MYADDLVGLADSPASLQSLAHKTREALVKWELKASVNPTDTSKTTVMLVKGGPSSARRFAANYPPNTTHSFTWGDISIPIVQSYRYLGVWLNATNTWDEHMAQRIQIAQKVTAIQHKVLTNVRLPMDLRKLTLTTIIQPVVTYAAQVWARPTTQLRQKLDSWQMTIAKRATHCPPNTSQICLQQELGLFPLHVTCDTLAIRYWHHLQQIPADRLLHQINLAWTGKAHPWARSMEKLLQQYNINTTQAADMTADQFKTYLDKQAISYLREYWTQPPRRYSGPVHARYVDSYGIGTLTATRPKLRKYIAEVFRTSSIACTGKGVELCMHMRLECLGLNAFHSHRRHGESAETQRNRELCPCCNNSPETPTHFFLECPAYSSPRSVLLAAAIADAHAQPIGPGPAATETWRVILANMCPGVIKYVQDCWSIRRAALAGRGANGGHPMALPPVPGLDAAG